MLGLALGAGFVGCSGDDGKDGTSCSVSRDDAGVASLVCDDGTRATLGSLGGGGGGGGCTVSDLADGSGKLISCADGTRATVRDGRNVATPDAGVCTVAEDADAGVQVVSCADGTRATIRDGRNGSSCTVTEDADAGVKTISCSDGTQAAVRDGRPCQVAKDGDAGVTTINCPSSSASVADGRSCVLVANANGTSTLKCQSGGDVTLPTPKCAPGARRCVGDDLEVCNAAGSSWAKKLTCPAGKCIADGAYCEGEGELRLADEVAPGFGRVEVFHDGVWGTVCDDGFGAPDTLVACRRLGYSTGDWRTNPLEQAADDVKIWIDESACWGNEESLANCGSNDWGDTDCFHYEDVALVCQP